MSKFFDIMDKLSEIYSEKNNEEGDFQFIDHKETHKLSEPNRMSRPLNKRLQSLLWLNTKSFWLDRLEVYLLFVRKKSDSSLFTQYEEFKQ